MFRLCVIVSIDNTCILAVRSSFGRSKKKKKKKKRESKKEKKADKLLKCRTVDNPVGENSSDDGIEICYQDDTDLEAFLESIQQLLA